MSHDLSAIGDLRYLRYIMANLPDFIDIADDFPTIATAPLYKPKADAIAAVTIKVGNVLERSPLPRTFGAADESGDRAAARDAESQLGFPFLKFLMTLFMLFGDDAPPVTE